ncbi:MAG: helix-turn-helix domain-containing protein, partial [Azovibrio sp.]
MKRQLKSRLTPMVATSISGSDNHVLVNVGARIKAARKALGMTQDELAALAGARSKSGLQDNEAGKNMPGGHMLGALVKAGVNANWLLSGKGEMLLADTTETTVKVDLD